MLDGCELDALARWDSCIIASISGRRPNRTDPNREDAMSVFPPQSGGVTPTGAGANRSLFSPDEFPHRTARIAEASARYDYAIQHSALEFQLGRLH